MKQLKKPRHIEETLKKCETNGVDSEKSSDIWNRWCEWKSL